MFLELFLFPALNASREIGKSIGLFVPIFILFCLLQTILKIPGFTDNVVTHLLAGLGAGFFAVCIGSPVDVVIFLYL